MQITRHTPYFTPDEYRALGMPYCCPLPVIEAHQWYETSFLPDIRSDEFAQWCDYVARTHCVELADDPLLIGYFYVDGPIWAHPSRHKKRAPIFDPARLRQPGGEVALFDLATRYYQVEYSPNLDFWAFSPGFVQATNTGVFNWLDTGPPLTASSPSANSQGANMEGFKVGQRVACAGAGYASHAEYNLVPRNC